MARAMRIVYSAVLLGLVRAKQNVQCCSTHMCTRWKSMVREGGKSSCTHMLQLLSFYHKSIYGLSRRSCTLVWRTHTIESFLMILLDFPGFTLKMLEFDKSPTVGHLFAVRPRLI
jgi:hypothetical protein